jgi:all-trans-retinol 13,14-reductase
LRPRSPVKGLFFAGSEVSSVGVIGAMMGGVLAALAAEPIQGMRLLRRLGM